jgi:hypothetical protein
VEPAHPALPYKSIALGPLPSRPEIAPLPGRSVSHTILPTVHSSTSIAENVPRSTRPILPQSYSTTALPTEPSQFVSRFATGPIRIIRPAPILQDDGGDPDGFIYPQSFGGPGPSRPTQHLGHGRKPIGPARRVVTAPTPGKEVLGHPTRTPAANKTLSRNVRDKVDEVEDQPVPVHSHVTDPSTPIPTRQKVQETPLAHRMESPLLPILPPDVEDVRDTSMLEPIGKELESPVPVDIAAMVPLPDEVDELVAEPASPEREIGIVDEPGLLVDEVDSALEPAVIEAISEPILRVDEGIFESASTVDEAVSAPGPTADEVTDEPESETTPLPMISQDQSTSVTEPVIDEAIAEPASAVEEVTVSAPSLDESFKAVSTIDETIHVLPTLDEATHAPVSTVDDMDRAIPSHQSNYVKAPLVDELPLSVPLEEAQFPTMPSADEETAEIVALEVPEETVLAEVELDPTPAIVIDVPASITKDAHTTPQSPDPPTKMTTTVVSEIETEPLVQAAASRIVQVEVVEDLPAASAPTQIPEDLSVAPTSTPTAEQVIAPISDVQDRQVTPNESEIDTATQAAPSMPLVAQLPISPEPSADQVNAIIPNVQTQTKAPSETKTNPVTRAPSRSANIVTRAPSRSAQCRPPVKAVQTVKSTTAPAPAPAPSRKPPVPRAAAISRPIKPVERKTFRPVTAAQTAAAASLAKVRNAQAVAQAEAAKPRVPSATNSKSAAVEPRSRVASAASSNSHGLTAASTKSSTNTTTAPAPVAKSTQSRLLAPTKASASRAAPTISHPSTKPTTSAIASNPALPPVRKEKIKLKAALPSFRPVRNAVRSTSGPGTGTWIASSTSKPVPRAAAIPLPHSPVSTKSVAKPETIALPPSPINRPETVALPARPTSSASRTVNAMQPASLPLPASPKPVAAEVPLPDSPISQASQLRSRVTRAASPAISALQARLATPSRNSSAPTTSDQDSDSEGEDEASGVTFKVKSNGRPQSGMKMTMKLKQSGTGDLMEFSAPARMEKVWIGSTTPMYTPGRKALVIRDANLASPLVRKVVNEE